MGRDHEIRAHVQPLIDRLYELYEQTDPSKGHVSERGKLQSAQYAIHIWWQVYGELLLWAQSQIAGYEVTKESPRWREELVKRLGGEFDEDSHELEQIGLSFTHLGILPNVEVLRKVIYRLLHSTAAKTSFWVAPLSVALRAANAGELDIIFEPTKTRRRGRPYQLDVARAIAIAHVYYLTGKGIKKYIALERIGNALAVEAETLRGWEKALRHDEWIMFDWKGAHLAGRLEDEIKEKSPLALVEEYGGEYLGPTSNFESARFFLERINNVWSLEEVKHSLTTLHGDQGENWWR